MPANPSITCSVTLFAPLGLVLSHAGCVTTGDSGHEIPSSLSFALEAEAAAFGPVAIQAAQTFVTVTPVNSPEFASVA